jgi:hypothetical protein
MAQNDTNRLTSNHGLSSVADLVVGGAMGMLLGILVGLSRSPVVGEITAALAALLVAFFGFKSDAASPAAPGNLRRIGAFCVAFALFVLLAVWIRANDLLASTPTKRVAAWTSAGFSEHDARALVAAQSTGAKFEVLAPNLRDQYKELVDLGFTEEQARDLIARRFSGGDQSRGRVTGEAQKVEPLTALFGTRSQRDFCVELQQQQPSTQEELIRYDQQGGTWKILADHVRKRIPSNEQGTVLKTIRSLFCEVE